MKVAKKVPTVVVILVMAFLSLPLFSAALPAGTAQEALTSKEARSLIGHAATPAQHAQLAAYYRQQAERCLREAKQHKEMTWPEGSASKHGWLGYKPGSHCRYWAEVLTKRAQQALALAASQERMAREGTNRG